MCRLSRPEFDWRPLDTAEAATRVVVRLLHTKTTKNTSTTTTNLVEKMEEIDDVAAAAIAIELAAAACEGDEEGVFAAFTAALVAAAMGRCRCHLPS